MRPDPEAQLHPPDPSDTPFSSADTDHMTSAMFHSSAAPSNRGRWQWCTSHKKETSTYGKVSDEQNMNNETY
jgi:hypothetical protein